MSTPDSSESFAAARYPPQRDVPSAILQFQNNRIRPARRIPTHAAEYRRGGACCRAQEAVDLVVGRHQRPHVTLLHSSFERL